MANEQKRDEIIRWLNKSADRLFKQRRDEWQKFETESGLVFQNGQVAMGSLQAPYYVEEFNFVQNDDGTWTREFVSRKFVC